LLGECIDNSSWISYKAESVLYSVLAGGVRWQNGG